MANNRVVFRHTTGKFLREEWDCESSVLLLTDSSDDASVFGLDRLEEFPLSKMLAFGKNLETITLNEKDFETVPVRRAHKVN